MGKSPCCAEDANLKKGPWTPEEDQKLVDYINRHGHGNWKALSKHAGLSRCGKSCRLRWNNYLRPDIKRGNFTEAEERVIIKLHSVLGNKWSRIANHLPGRTDNEIKNYWNTHIRKKLLNTGIDPHTHKPRTDLDHLLNLSQLLCGAQLGNLVSPWPWDTAFKLQADAAQLVQNLMQIMNTNKLANVESAGFLGSQNPYPLEGLHNGISSLLSAKELALRPQDIPNNAATMMPQASSDDCQAVENPWAYFQGGFNNENLDMNNQSLSINSFEQSENAIPELVSGSPETSPVNQMESSKTAPDSTIYETWEKLIMEDEDWKEILDFASSSSSPVSW